jgi:hypothetical protein
MPSIRVDAYRSIPFPITLVRQCLVDFHEGQPRLLPPDVQDYAVLQGGIGEGTVVTCDMNLRNRVRHFSFRISEPIHYKTLTAYDHDSRLTISWHMRAEGESTEVQIEAFWTEPDSFLDFMVIIWAQIKVRGYLNHILNRMPAVIVENGYENVPL